MTTSRPTVLVVDDDPTLLDILAYNLRGEGYRVLVAAEGVGAVRCAYQDHPDVIILDLMLPDLSGVEVCRAVRRQLHMPILILSAREEEATKVQALDAGADQYLTKPYQLRELLARVRALLRRTEETDRQWELGSPLREKTRPMRQTPTAMPPIQVGELQIDRAGRVVRLKGQLVPMKPKEFDLLTFLALHPRQVFTREMLLDQVWGGEFFGGTRTVDVHIRWLRTSLEQDPADPQLLQTVYGVGYKFVPLEDAPGSTL